MTHFKTRLLLFVFLLLVLYEAAAQHEPIPDTVITYSPKPVLLSLVPADSFHKGRFWLAAGSGTTIYSGVSMVLWNAWYKDYPLSGFHTFNDWGEWKDMDKAGHLFSAYIASNYAFQGARWTGMKRRNALWTAIGVGSGIQATIEIMDGFSEKWGFSFGDIGFNTLGVGFFATQELLWQEQRIIMKVSSVRPGYSSQPIYSVDTGQTTTLEERAARLYGTSFFHIISKDYNAQTVWSSANIRSFLGENYEGKFPHWLNLAFGYGTDNIFGGFDNRWEQDGAVFELHPQDYPRYRQFYLSPDIDFSRIPTRHRWLRFTLWLFNWLKFPGPALEINTLGKTRLHWLYW